ncbi:MAG: hypothetical protein ACE5JR_04050 [Gemmatimonadota bacterium]
MPRPGWDTLLGLFWPEATEDRARIGLNQAVFVLRRALGNETIVTGGAGELRLAPGRLWCDAGAFEGSRSPGSSS